MNRIILETFLAICRAYWLAAAVILIVGMFSLLFFQQWLSFSACAS